MKTLSIKIISCVLIFNVVLAQNTDLSVDIQKIQNTDDWEFNLQYQFKSPVVTGIFIELPDKFIVTPISIRVNDQEMWLKNSSDASNNDAAIHWENTENGLVLRFTNNLIQSGNQLLLKGLSSISSNLDNDIIISLKQMVDNDQMSEDIIVSNNLNIIR